MDDTTALETKDLVVEGDRSELRLEAGRFVLRKEATTQAEPTEVSFGVDQVRAATLNRPSGGEPGWLHVAVVGGSPPPPGGLAAASDPYTLPLAGRATGSARRLAKMIERHVQVRGLPRDERDTGVRPSTGVVVNPVGTPPPAAASGDDLVRRLQELAQLHQVGALTDEEFERAKARVLE